MSMVSAVDYQRRVQAAPLTLAYVVLGAFTALLVGLQMLPLVLPIGPMYWDVLIYYDAIGRMGVGQLPVRDFFTPVGPLEYGLAYLSNSIFPSAHPVLLTQWIWLPVTVPVMAVLIGEAGKTNRAAAFGLMLPWMLFTALPFNIYDFYPYPGTDAFGIYNRHGAHLLYLLAATVLFVKGRAVQTGLLSVLLLALAFCKITAFIAAAPILIAGLVLGRIALSTAIATAAICLSLAGLVEVTTGIVSGYVLDIILLASQNTDAILPRFFTVVSQRFDVLAAGGALSVVLLAAVLMNRRANEGETRAGLIATLDRDWFWLGLLLVCGLFYETQNTGSHEFILIWPALLMVLLSPARLHGRSRTAVLVLVALTALPTATKVAHKAIRTAAVAPGYITLDAPDLGPIGRISAKDVFVEQAERMRGIYIDHQDTMRAIAATEALPSFIQFSEPDFQYLLIQELQDATLAIRKLEADTGRQFATVFNLDFANPFPYILNRPGPLHVAIGADPSRAIPTPDAETLAAIADTDLILAPVCPINRTRETLKSLYVEAMTGHQKISLTPCFDAYVKPLGR